MDFLERQTSFPKLLTVADASTCLSLVFFLRLDAPGGVASPAEIKPAIFHLLGRCVNHYTMEPQPLDRIQLTIHYYDFKWHRNEMMILMLNHPGTEITKSWFYSPSVVPFYFLQFCFSLFLYFICVWFKFILLHSQHSDYTKRTACPATPPQPPELPV